MSRIKKIHELLEKKFPGACVRIRDDSALHASHYQGDGDASHLHLEVVSDAFASLGRVPRQQRVYEVLKAEFAEGLHALSLTCLTPQEDAAKKD